MYRDNPMMYIGVLFEALLFQGSTLGWDIAGTRESVRSMTRARMAAFRKHFYHADRMVFGLAGNIDTKVLPVIEERFGRLARRSYGKKFARFATHQRAPRILLHTRETEQVHLALGFPSYPRGDRRLPTLRILDSILGGNMSSRLFIAIRERKGLAYYVHSSIDTFEDTGSFAVGSGLTASKIEQAIKIIVKELHNIREHGVTEKELEKAKHFMRGKMTLALEETDAVVDWYAKQALFGHEVKTPEEKMKELFAVTNADIKRVACEIFNFSKVNLAMIGPFKGEEERFKKLLRI